MDMRTFGKDYERYLNRAESEHGVKLVRCRPHSVFPAPDADALSVTYTPYDESVFKSENFDMVVLSTGFRVPEDLKALAGNLGIELNSHDFAKTDSFSPVATSRPGIYVCGLFESPKDIPETMIQASAAAGMASLDLAPVKENGAAEEMFPEGARHQRRTASGRRLHLRLRVQYRRSDRCRLLASQSGSLPESQSPRWSATVAAGNR